jgi:hypothetical protein
MHDTRLGQLAAGSSSRHIVLGSSIEAYDALNRHSEASDSVCVRVHASNGGRHGYQGARAAGAALG